ncbi:MAG: hypothetical protein GWN58_27610 [Anaerolineae bacterium]|nr:hypothetical protein [Anaerolineae bacterium]
MINIMHREDVCLDHIWRDGEFTDLAAIPVGQRKADLAIVTINRDRADLVARQIAEFCDRCEGLTTDIYTIEMGSSYRSEHETFWYEDPEYRGKPYGHNVGVRIARATGDYRYYYIAMNDVFCPDGQDVPRILVDVMDANPELGILSPTCETSGYTSAKPRPGMDYHSVTSADYLIQMMRADAVRHGFFNPDFKYCWNVELELSYQLFKAGYKAGYCDKAQRIHYGTSTWGKVKGLPSKKVYKQRAKAFAVPYWIEKYGYDWDELFSEVLPADVEFNRFKLIRLDQQGLGGDKPKPIKLYLGCGGRYARDYLNVDSTKQDKTDAIYELDDIRYIAPGSVAEIKCFLALARLPAERWDRAFAHWHSLLEPGALLVVHLLHEKFIEAQPLIKRLRRHGFEDAQVYGGRVVVKKGA